MMRFLSVVVLVLTCCLFVFGQNNQTSSCPKINIASAGVPQPGDITYFTAHVKGIDLTNLTYKWEVTTGEIIKGQGTSSIEVQIPKDWRENLTATVEIKGFPEGCPNTAAESAVVVICRLPITLADYGRISFREEKAFLDLVYLELKEKPDSAALFIIHFTAKDNFSAIKIRVQKITDFLVKTRLIPKEKLKFVFSEGDFYQTRIYLLPPDALNSFPEPATTLEEIEAKRKNRQK